MTASQKAWYTIDGIDSLDTPALVIFPERVKQNIRHAVNMVDDVQRLRPHVKTHKCREACMLMMEAGIRKFKCATIAEAEMLGICGAPDVLLAYQPNGPKLLRFICVIKKYPSTKYSCLTDNIDTATEQSAAFTASGLRVNVYLDVNVGMNRTGIPPGEEALHVYNAAAQLPGIHMAGLHAYDGQIRQPDFETKKKACDEAFAGVDLLKSKMVDAGLPSPIIVAGGSPSFSVHCHRGNVECSPGTFVYWDHGYSVLCPEQPFVPAAVLVTRVISLPTPTRLCLDLGHKSVAAENEISKRVHFLNAAGLVPVSQSEEHLVVEVPPDHTYQPGDVLYALPYHVCPTIALYERAYTITEAQATGEWLTIARDRRITC
jgi:D-threonine aldolase